MQPAMRAFRSRRTLVSCGALLGVFAVVLTFTLVASMLGGHVVDAGTKPSHGGSSQAVDEREPTTGPHSG